ncbi:hypothetical protein EX30DRAFT_336981 [Ascodesmis nigricans]|uniref:Uncharacterized protein n=1 Tax=Ascodesmis nigricans TaxID=341454 RepID=A0A4S2N5K7_9PEZI|nr:hypothetical protein EX30DRAFT_336981 [Ascodesmis nigricans]
MELPFITTLLLFLLPLLARAQNICMQRLSIGSYKFANPNLSGNLEIHNGYAFFGVTPNSDGFPSYVYPNPRGQIFTPTVPGSAYLSPVSGGPSGLYNLRWGTVPGSAVPLSKLFYATGCGCGGNCGGACVVVDDTPADEFNTGLWLATAPVNLAGAPAGSWQVRWWNGTTGLPTGHNNVLLWRGAWA